MTTTNLTLEQVELAERLADAYELFIQLGDENTHKSFESDPYKALDSSDAFRAGRSAEALSRARDAVFGYLLNARHSPGGEMFAYALRVHEHRELQRRELEEGREFGVKGN